MLKLSRKGFTLVELLVVIGILTILLAIVLVAINPARQFAQANNAKRRSDVSVLLNAITQYQADHNGQLPTGISTGSATTVANGAGNADICAALVSTYTAQMPVDPQTGTYTDCTAYNSGYTAVQSASNNRVTICAPAAELGETICVTR